MRPTRIVKSDVFRLAALFAFLFLSMTGVLLGTVLFIIEGTQTAALASANDADIATIINGFLDEGVPEAIEVVKQRLGSPRANRPVYPDCYMILEKEGGEILAGNLPFLVPHVGPLTITVPASTDLAGNSRNKEFRRPRVVLGRGVEVTHGVYLFVGRDTTLFTATRERIRHAFTWVALGAVFIAVMGGLALGSRFLRRVDVITQTCQAIIAGRLDERVPVSGRQNEWDRLAEAINEMLNRISILLENLRQVSSDVAHDLRTPLTRMRNRLEEARTKSTNISEFSNAVAIAIEDTDQLLAMFAAVLRISQVESGTRLGSFSSISLTQILENVHQMYLPVAEDYQHTLTLKAEQGVFIRGDAELLTQMFVNLIENAIRHTPEHTLIQILLEHDADSAVVSVVDNGPGIDPSEHEKVLRRFYRVSTSRSSAGHGLGLALVAAIAQLHQAKLRLSSANPGLQVELVFPLRADPDQNL